MSVPLFVTFTESASGKQFELDCTRIVAIRDAEKSGSSIELDTQSDKEINGETRTVEDFVEVLENRDVVKNRVHAAVLEDQINFERARQTIRKPEAP